jgi:hypothetical protein
LLHLVFITATVSLLSLVFASRSKVDFTAELLLIFQIPLQPKGLLMPTLVRTSSCISKLLPLALCLALAGCGVSPSPTTTTIDASTIHGTLHGGVNPINGAAITLWETQTSSSSAYGSAGKSLATATTGLDGGFTFSGTYTCTSTEYVYITATGGNTGGNTANNQSLLLAALGSCSNFSSSTADAKIMINISEVSSAAAAYTLGNFMSVSDSGNGLQSVAIGAPANNAATAPACTGTGASMACTAGGLQHAFANAANLVDAVHYDGTTPSGAAYTVAPSNTDSVAPASLLNTLGNIIQSCTNSDGGLAADKTANNCKSLFVDATPTGGSAPADTLEALLDIAQNPANNVTNLFNLAAPNTSFQPNLSTAPADFSLAIFYFGTVVSGTTTPFTVPNALTLDAADNVYVERSDALSGSATYVGVSGMSSNGKTLFTGATETTYLAPEMMSTDAAGHIWLTNNTITINSVAHAASVQAFSESTGAATCALGPTSGYARGIAVDRNNNIWFSRASGSIYTLGEFPAPTFSGSSCTSTQASFTNTPLYAEDYPWGIAIDSNQNVWGVVESSSAAYAYVFPNTGGTTPTYNNSLVTATGTSLTYGYGIAIDASGNAWVPFDAKQAEIVPTSTASIVSSIAISSKGAGGASSAYYPEFDGANTMWFPGNTAGGYVWALPSAGTAPTGYRPCYAASGGGTCTSSELSNAEYLQVDSTGSLWVSASTNGVVAQILGIAAPTWPQLSYGHPATTPN